MEKIAIIQILVDEYGYTFDTANATTNIFTNTINGLAKDGMSAENIARILDWINKN